ncbi:hypothetical protein Y032_0164g3519 [Ancylostoma ceylanicum]|nr:hypothetical protein Y032_0164g3519 [Ancylostoma ceylanicum]
MQEGILNKMVAQCWSKSFTVGDTCLYLEGGLEVHYSVISGVVGETSMMEKLKKWIQFDYPPAEIGSLPYLTYSPDRYRTDEHKVKRWNPSLRGRVSYKNTLAQNDLAAFLGSEELGFIPSGTKIQRENGEDVLIQMSTEAAEMVQFLPSYDNSKSKCQNPTSILQQPNTKNSAKIIRMTKVIIYIWKRWHLALQFFEKFSAWCPTG